MHSNLPLSRVSFEPPLFKSIQSCRVLTEPLLVTEQESGTATICHAVYIADCLIRDSCTNSILIRFMLYKFVNFVLLTMNDMAFTWEHLVVLWLWITFQASIVRLNPIDVFIQFDSPTKQHVPDIKLQIKWIIFVFRCLSSQCGSDRRKKSNLPYQICTTTNSITYANSLTFAFISVMLYLIMTSLRSSI